MILSALYDYYFRLLGDPASGISPQGYTKTGVSYALEITDAGRLLAVVPLGRTEGKRILASQMDVPDRPKRSGIGAIPSFLCDNSTYLLGIDKDGGFTTSRLEAAAGLHSAILESCEDQGARAVLAFFKNWLPEDGVELLQKSGTYGDIISGGNIVFRLEGDVRYIHQRPKVMSAWSQHLVRGQGDTSSGQCLVTGNISPVARLHRSVKLPGGASTGVSMVSFNFASVESYGMQQGQNSPVSEAAAFAYGTALDALLTSRKHRFNLSGEVTMVVWAERSGAEENLLLDLYADALDVHAGLQDDTPHASESDSERVVHILERIRQGLSVSDQMSTFDPSVKFYILGLSANVARLVVRLWNVDTFGSLLEHARLHFDDMSIVHAEWERTVSAGALLAETTPTAARKPDKVAPTLVSSLNRAILQGSMYPDSLYSAIIRRIRADSDDPKRRYIQKISYPRVAFIKAYLSRKARLTKDINLKEAVTPVLEEKNVNPAYLIGRLFALLEKVQLDANPSLNSTIKDRYYASASTTPAAVFPMLIRLAQHHIAKSAYGRRIDSLIEGVMQGLGSFPAHLTLDQQGLFVLGYYHQRHALFSRTEKQNASEVPADVQAN